MLSNIKHFLLGKPLTTHALSEEKLSNSQGLAIFGSDALSSTAYATEEILWVLAAVGSAALFYSIPITLAIVAVILIVAFSYRQTIHAYPQGGGAYTVARENLGELPGLIAASSLLIDYILTAAVSVAAGVAAVTSALPGLFPLRVEIAVAVIILLLWGNIRGVRESGKIFSIPTYLFIAALFGLLGYGFFRMVTGSLPSPMPYDNAALGASSIGLFLLLRAFSSGSTALTGLEATSNGVGAFREPSAKNAANTLTILTIILAIIFLGLSVFAYKLHITPLAEETVVSQIARTFFGRNIFYFLIQGTTALILLLAANTPFADFPRVAAILAKDKYFPHQFLSLGSRLIYTNGIAVLAAAAAGLLIFFRADTHHLIPLYAIGVFVGFTLSQFGMVIHWRKMADQARHKKSMMINGFGALLTFVVTIITFSAKFSHGAWILVPTIIIMVILMRIIRAHYTSVAAQLSLKNPRTLIPHEKTVIILVSGVHQGTLKAIEIARTLRAAHLKAVHVAIDAEDAERIQEKWRQYGNGIKLDIIPSPYRTLIEPLVSYIDQIEKRWNNDTVIVVIPEFVPTRFWHHFLHTQTAAQIRWALEHREDVEILDVPYRLK